MSLSPSVGSSQPRQLLFITSQAWPYPTGNGVSVLTMGLLTAFENLGYQPWIVPLGLCRTDPAGRSARRLLRDRGYRVLEFPHLGKSNSTSLSTRVRRTLYPATRDLVPRDEHVEGMLSALVEQEGIEVGIGFGWHALGLLQAVPVSYRIASIVDLLGRHVELRRDGMTQISRHRRPLAQLNLFHLQRMEQVAMEYLRGADLILEHAAHHARELEDLGYENVRYLPHPLPDPDPVMLQRFEHSRGKESAQEKTILVAGSLKGASSRQGFEYLIEELMPRLEDRSTREDWSFRVRIVGHGDMLPSLRARLEAWPQIEIVGYVDDIVREYVRADIFLVAIPVEQGFRTRIAEAFSFGLCVVAHAANAAGMPELEDGQNALISESPEGLADRLVAALREPELRARLGQEARATFQRDYALSTATEKLRNWLTLAPTLNCA